MWAGALLSLRNRKSEKGAREVNLAMSAEAVIGHKTWHKREPELWSTGGVFSREPSALSSLFLWIKEELVVSFLPCFKVVVVAVCVSAGTHSLLTKKRPKPCKTMLLVINKSVKWQKTPLHTSLRLWNDAILFWICVSTVCVCVCTSHALSGIIIQWPREAKWLNYNQSGLINL